MCPCTLIQKSRIKFSYLHSRSKVEKRDKIESHALSRIENEDYAFIHVLIHWQEQNKPSSIIHALSSKEFNFMHAIIHSYVVRDPLDIVKISIFSTLCDPFSFAKVFTKNHTCKSFLPYFWWSLVVHLCVMICDPLSVIKIATLWDPLDVIKISTFKKNRRDPLGSVQGFNLNSSTRDSSWPSWLSPRFWPQLFNTW